MGDLFAPVLKLKQELPKLEGMDGGRPEAIKSGLEMASQTAPSHSKSEQGRPTQRKPSGRTSKRRQKV
jgi:hypothetical protein